MTSQPDSDSFSVWIGGRRAGMIYRVADRTRFALDLDYRDDPDRPVLGLVFEDRPERVHVATVRLAPWFSNLLPVPEVMLMPRDRIDARLPASVWPEHEEFAYAIRRFDRDEQRRRIHIEDLAQVRNVYPENKYKSNFETVASLIYRGRDTDALLEFTRRLTFSVLIANGDYHLKNWSLIYADGRVPSLAPAYDLMSTAYYFIGERVEDLGLKFGGSRAFHRVTLATFRRLQERLGVHGVDLAECAAATVERTLTAWPRHAGLLDRAPRLQEAIDQSIRMRGKTITGSVA